MPQVIALFAILWITPFILAGIVAHPANTVVIIACGFAIGMIIEKLRRR